MFINIAHHDNDRGFKSHYCYIVIASLLEKEFTAIFCLVALLVIAMNSASITANSKASLNTTMF